MKTHTPLLFPRIPVILSQEIKAALDACRARGLEGDHLTYYLEIWRNKNSKKLTFAEQLAKCGLTPILVKPDSDSYTFRRYLSYHYVFKYKELEALDKAFMRLHEYRAGGWDKYISQHVAEEINRKRSKCNRSDPLNKLLFQIISLEPSISFEKLIEELRKHAEVRDSIIDTVKDNYIEWRQGKATMETSFDAIEARWYRIRKKI